MILTAMQKEIVRAIELHGGVTAGMCERHGWTVKGLPTPEMRQLTDTHRVVAPRVLTSVPLNIVWQFRSEATRKETLVKIEKEASRARIKEYAPGGFMLLTPAQDRELAAKKVRAMLNSREGRGKSRG